MRYAQLFTHLATDISDDISYSIDVTMHSISLVPETTNIFISYSVTIVLISILSIPTRTIS